MKASELAKEVINIIVKFGDVDIKVGLLTEYNDIQFDKEVDVIVGLTKGDKRYIEIYAEIQDIKKFKEDIKVLCES